MILLADSVGVWGAAAIGGGIGTVISAAGVFAVRYFRGRGGYAKDVAEARVAVSAEERKARREQEDADRKARREQENTERAVRREEEDAERKEESAILKEYKQLVREQKTDLAEQRQLIHDLRDEMQALATDLALCRAGRAKADERIAALEEALDDAGIAHRHWDPDAIDGGGSKPHKLPPGNPK